MLLPPEDLENTALRTLVGDILADLILGNEASGRACEGWFLWQCIANLVDVVKPPDPAQNEARSSPPPQEKKSRDGSARAYVSEWTWSLLLVLYWVYIGVRFVIDGLLRAASTDPLIHSPTSPADSGNSASSTAAVGKRPVLDYRVYGMLGRLLKVAGRMPWLEGSLALLQYLALEGPGRLGHAGGVLDR